MKKDEGLKKVRNTKIEIRIWKKKTKDKEGTKFEVRKTKKGYGIQIKIPNSEFRIIKS